MNALRTVWRRPGLGHFDTAKAFGLPRGAFVLVGREKDGETPSTEETLKKVATCIAKGCLHGGSGDQDAYTRDGVCPETQLPVMHRTEGTGKDEAGNRCTYDMTGLAHRLRGSSVVCECCVLSYARGLCRRCLPYTSSSL